MIIAVVVFLLVIAAAIPGVMGWRAGAALQARIDELTAAGEPMTVAAMFPPVDMDDTNGYVELRQAMALIDDESPASARVDLVPQDLDLPLTSIERAMLIDVNAERAAAVPLIEKAAKKPLCLVDLQRPDPAFMTQMLDLTRLRTLATTIRYQALIAYDAGRHDEAVRQAQLLETVARGAESHGAIVAYLIGVGCRSMQADLLAAFAPELKIGDAAGSVPPKALRRVIIDLLDESVEALEVRNAWRAERVMNLQLLMGVDAGRYSFGGMTSSGPTGSNPPKTSGDPFYQRYVSRPMLRGSALTCINNATANIAALQLPDWPSASAQVDLAAADIVANPNAARNRLAKLLLPSNKRVVEAHYRVLADRRLAAISLAIRWFEVDHGALPESLEKLVPQYLSAVPLDPMAANRGFIYRTAGSDPIVYSVGPDGRDDAGDESAVYKDLPAATWKQPDRVNHLRRQPRVLSPEVQAMLKLGIDSPLGELPAPAFTPIEAGRFDAVTIPDMHALKWFKVTGGPKTMRNSIEAYYRFDVADPVDGAGLTAEETSKPYCQGEFADDAGVWRFTFFQGLHLILVRPDGKAGAFICGTPIGMPREPRAN